MRTLFATFLSALVLTGCSASTSDRDVAQIAEIIRAAETQLVMPPGADAPDAYAKFFAVNGEIDGRRVIFGRYVEHRIIEGRDLGDSWQSIPGRKAAYWSDQDMQAFFVLDGGCVEVSFIIDYLTASVVDFEFEPYSPRTSRNAGCNGEA